MAVILADGASPSDRRVEEWQPLSDAASSRFGKAVISTRSSPKPYVVGVAGYFQTSLVYMTNKTAGFQVSSVLGGPWKFCDGAAEYQYC